MDKDERRAYLDQMREKRHSERDNMVATRKNAAEAYQALIRKISKRDEF